MEFAERFPVGAGRGAPNTRPFLPPPSGRMTLSLNPCYLLYELLGPDICRNFACVFACLAYLVLVVLLEPYQNLLIALAGPTAAVVVLCLLVVLCCCCFTPEGPAEAAASTVRCCGKAFRCLCRMWCRCCPCLRVCFPCFSCTGPEVGAGAREGGGKEPKGPLTLAADGGNE